MISESRLEVVHDLWKVYTPTTLVNEIPKDDEEDIRQRLINAGFVSVESFLLRPDAIVWTAMAMVIHEDSKRMAGLNAGTAVVGPIFDREKAERYVGLQYSVLQQNSEQ